MSTIYAIGCLQCCRKVDVARSTRHGGVEQGLACASHQQLLNFLADHGGKACRLIYGDSVEDDRFENFRDDTDRYPDEPLTPNL